MNDERFFNTEGPISEDIHYHVPPLRRFDLDEVLALIRRRKYFVLHAPRQTGKTSALLALMAELNRSEHWVERFQYKEAGPQLLLQAFLQRIANSGGRVEREYGLGRMRTDLLIVWPANGDAKRMRKTGIECKLCHASLDETLRQGVEQTRAYMDRCDAKTEHLVVFDRSAGRSWDDKVFRRQAPADDRITVWGM